MTRKKSPPSQKKDHPREASVGAETHAAVQEEDVAQEAREYFSESLDRLRASNELLSSEEPDFALAKMALRVAELGPPSGRRGPHWYIDLPSGTHLVNLQADWIGQFKIHPDIMMLAKQIIHTELEEFHIAVMVLTVFGQRYGIDAAELLSGPDEATILRLKAAVYNEQQAVWKAKDAAEAQSQDDSRVRFDDESRSVWIDGELVAKQVQPTPYGFFKIVANAKGQQVTGESIRKEIHFAGKNLSRDCISKLPAKLRNVVTSKKGGGGGYCLTLPPAG